MRSYNPKEWWKIVLDFHKSDTLRKLLPVLIGVGVYSFCIAFIERHYIDAEHKTLIKSLSLIHTFWVLSFLFY